MHVGIIMDGNRRYATKKKLFPKFKGHLEGKKALENLLIKWAKLDEPYYLTLYAFSLHNLKKRNLLERKFIYKLLEMGFKEMVDFELIYRDKIRVNFIGDLNSCPKGLRKIMNEISERTKRHNGKVLNFAVCYDGHEEIVSAVNNILSSNIKKASEKTIKHNIYTKNLPPLDLIIRTGGEKRLSGFMLWDSSYAELIFRDELWPEYNYKMFRADLDEFKKRKRRFGK